MRRRAIAHLASFVVSFASVAAAVAAPAADDARVSGPFVHDNLAIFLLHATPAGGPVPLTLQEALAKGTVRVDETGSVNELTVENTGSDEVFVQAGDIVKGGRQDRVLSVDLLLPSRSGRVAIAAFCVEQGRWTARGSEDSARFSSSGAAMPSVEAKRAMRTFAVASAPPAGGNSLGMAYAAVGASQSAIWGSVRKTQERLKRSVGAPVEAAASPSSLQLSLESEKLKQVQTAYITALQSAGEKDADVVGYVFAVNGKIQGGDTYTSNALFRKMWRKLLTAGVTEAISHKEAAGAATPSTKDVEAFLASSQGGTQAEHTISDHVRLATRDSDTSLFTETRRADGGWVHRNYLVK